MFAEIVNFGPTIRLVPNSSIQFVEYAFNLESFGRLSRRFIERPPSRAGRRGDANTCELIPAWVDADDPAGVEPAANPSDREYTISERGALEMFLQKWVPVPMLRVRAGTDGSEELDRGPTNWARVRVAGVGHGSHGNAFTHRVVFAFDTHLLERRKNRPYAAPSHEDAANQQEFRFAYRFRDIAWFLGALPAQGESAAPDNFQDWVPAWLNEMFRELKQAQRPERALRDSDFPNELESHARYLVFLELLARAVKPRAIRLIDTVSDNAVAKPVSVDLILDVGNSRTCGILVSRTRTRIASTSTTRWFWRCATCRSPSEYMRNLSKATLSCRRRSLAARTCRCTRRGDALFSGRARCGSVRKRHASGRPRKAPRLQPGCRALSATYATRGRSIRSGASPSAIMRTTRIR
jgi:hypothetical protein